jgi:hypothetical protein
MMRIRLHGSLGAAAAASLMLAASAASAATSVNNSLTGFTGDSTQASTQAALAAVGLGFTSTAGSSEDPPGTFVDPTVVFDSAGAHFGDLFPGAGGRNYIRTTAADYANYSFTAEVTWITADPGGQAAYFGLGSGRYGTFRIADYDGSNAAVQLFLELNGSPPFAFTMKANNFYPPNFGSGAEATGMDVPGTHRLRLTYDWFRKTADFAIDANYAGGPFTADVSLPTVSTLDLYGKLGWPSEVARVYFGGDDGTVYKDLNITLNSSGVVFGDLNNSGTITVADWVVLRNNQLADLSAMTFQQAYAAGDLTADKANNQADFALFKLLYENAHGIGSFAAIANVPEPASLFILSGGVGIIQVLRRGRRRG